jgi:hypothetical protein
MLFLAAARRGRSSPKSPPGTRRTEWMRLPPVRPPHLRLGNLGGQSPGEPRREVDERLFR